MMNPLLQLRDAGQQIWLDNLSRTLLREGELAHLIAEGGVSGLTTNPAIFHKAIAGGRYYEDDLARLKTQGQSAEQRYEALVIADVQQACELFLPLHAASGGEAGYVSLEVSPALAEDAAASIAAGLRLRAAVDRPNLLIKVPATAAGLEAIEGLLAAGVSVNVTLMFSLADVDAVARAYLRGLERLQASGGDVGRVCAVASLFLSRVDTLVDKLLADAGADPILQGRTAVAMARLAYQTYRERFHGEEFARLRALGARPQRMLWASTGTKNPAYSDLLYVEPLVGRETINTLPDATLAALRDHGRVKADTLEDGLAEAHAHYATLAALGLDLDQIGAQLQREGLRQFDEAFAGLLELTA